MMMKTILFTASLVAFIVILNGQPTREDESSELQDPRRSCSSGQATADNKCCVFPFKYKGKMYSHCISANNKGKQWCGVTRNYDKDKKWGNCVGGCASGQATTSHQCCVFPFKYKGKMYNHCISANNKNKQWCGVTRNYDKDKKWGNCAASGFKLSNGKRIRLRTGCASGQATADHKCCVFPFKYKGKKYSHCITAHHHKEWCGITSNYDKDKKWGNCVASGSGSYTRTRTVTTYYVRKKIVAGDAPEEENDNNIEEDAPVEEEDNAEEANDEEEDNVEEANDEEEDNAEEANDEDEDNADEAMDGEESEM